MMMKKLGGLRTKVIGSVLYDPEVAKRGLEGDILITCSALEEVKQIINRLEKFCFG